MLYAAAQVKGEYGLSETLLGAGYNLATLMARYAPSTDWREKRHWHCNNNVHPSRHGTYDGISMHPFETVFIKARCGLPLRTRASQGSGQGRDDDSAATPVSFPVHPQPRSHPLHSVVRCSPPSLPGHIGPWMPSIGLARLNRCFTLTASTTLRMCRVQHLNTEAPPARAAGTEPWHGPALEP